MKFQIGDKVEKCTGDYKFPGVVVAAFTTTRGKERYVVECVSEDCRGILHIYNETNLKLAHSSIG